MKASEILGLVSVEQDCDISGLAFDSRAVKAGDLFFAIAGTHQDGARYIDDAVRKGAAGIVASGPRPTSLPDSISYVAVADTRSALAHAAAKFYARQPDTIVAVTGTSGKTSVADFTRQIFIASGYHAASIGTLGVITKDKADYGSLTTPDPVALHKMIDALAGQGITHLAMEASSHGLDQKRIDGVRLKAAAFTNLGHDHLDYHGTMEAYLTAKLRLFDTLLPADGTVVVNADAPESKAVAEGARLRGLKLISVGRVGEDLRLVSETLDRFDQILALDWQGRGVTVRLPLAGEFQTANALVAAGLAIAVGVPPAYVFDALSQLSGVKGRLERVGIYHDALIVIDYAHKPEALENALSALRPFVQGKLICVFGCGGDRDRAKRPIMGGIAARLADHVIVTDDNPRSEIPSAIRAEIMTAVPDAIEIGDRRLAIETAMRMARAGDVVVIAGKGHETGQILADHIAPFSDHEEVARFVQEKSA